MQWERRCSWLDKRQMGSLKYLPREDNDSHKQPRAGNSDATSTERVGEDFSGVDVRACVNSPSVKADVKEEEEHGCFRRRRRAGPLINRN